MDCPHQQFRPRIIKVEYKDSMLLHRHHITTLLQALLVLCTFSACINDEFADDVAGTEHTTHPCYLNIQLKFDEDMSATRAAVTNGDNLEYGDHAEHMIGETGNYIILFKGDNLFDVCELTAMTGHKHNTEDGRPEEDDGDNSNKNNGVADNIEATYTYSSKFDAEDEEDFPTSCLVVLNASEKISEKLKGFKGQQDKGVSDILSIMWDETKVEDNPKDIGFSDNTHKYFTLTNSIYFKANNAGKRDTVGIPKDFIGKTLAAATPLTIYVERMVAKFSFELPSKPESEEKTNIFRPSEYADLMFFDGFSTEGVKHTAKKWRVEVTGWSVNALEPASYLFKNIDEGQTADIPNNAANYRTHWCEDPHYDYQIKEQKANPWTYPWQYRKVIDEANIRYYKEEDHPTVNNNLLRNYSFDALKLNRLEEDKEIDFDEVFNNKIIYTPENTYDADVVAGQDGRTHDSRGELLAGTHLLVGAELQIKKTIDDEDDDFETLDHIYRDYFGTYYKSTPECFGALMTAFNQSLISNELMDYTLYDWDKYVTPDSESCIAKSEGEYRLYLDEEELTDDYLEKIMEMTEEQFEHEFGTLAPATLRRGDGKCLPWLDGSITESNSRLQILKREGNSFVPLAICKRIKSKNGLVYAGDKLRDADANDIKSLLYEWIGAVAHFNHGKMYYSHGIYNPTLHKTDPKYYGVVRNNWYRFKLNDIGNMGIPVDDPTEPIVPDRVDNEDKLNVTIKILDWHQVETTIENL